MLNERDMFKLLGRFIADEIGKQIAPVRDEIASLKHIVELNKSTIINGDTEFSERIARVEKVLADLPVPVNGKDGRDGVDGKNVDMDVVADVIQHAAECCVDARLATWPKPKDGADGKDGRDGRDGTDGKDLSVDEILPTIDSVVADRVALLPPVRGISGCLVDRAGGLVVTFSDGSVQNVGPVVGKDGAPGNDGKDGMTRDEIKSAVKDMIAEIPLPKDGKDGAGFDDVEMQYDGERALSFVFFRNDPLKTKQFNFTLPIPFYREVWREKPYDQFDIVQRDGSMWIAIKDTTTAPGASTDWKLCVKRGQNGRQGEPGPPGPRGEPATVEATEPAAWPRPVSGKR